MPKYKQENKKTKVLYFKEFSEKFDNGLFKRTSHRSFIAFLYWFGVRVTEALNLRMRAQKECEMSPANQTRNRLLVKHLQRARGMVLLNGFNN